MSFFTPHILDEDENFGCSCGLQWIGKGRGIHRIHLPWIHPHQARTWLSDSIRDLLVPFSFQIGGKVLRTDDRSESISAKSKGPVPSSIPHSHLRSHTGVLHATANLLSPCYCSRCCPGFRDLTLKKMRKRACLPKACFLREEGVRTRQWAN